jgi:hypothetical protein
MHSGQAILPQPVRACLRWQCAMLGLDRTIGRADLFVKRSGVRTNSLAVALAAALLLVLQSVFGAVAMGAETVQRDIFGNVICTDSGAERSHGQDPGGRHLPNCCTLSCAACVHGPADLPASAGLQHPAAVAVAHVYDRAPAPIHLAQRRTPANPRAPPQAA